MIIVERYQFTVTYLGKEFRSVYLLERCDLIRRAQRHESGSLRGIEPRDSIAQEFSAISFGRSLVIQILNHQYVATIVELRMLPVCKFARAAGKLAATFGVRYDEYAVTHGR